MFQAYNKTLDYIEKLEDRGRIFVIRPQFDGAGRVERDMDKLTIFYRHGYEYAGEIYDSLVKWLNARPEYKK